MRYDQQHMTEDEEMGEMGETWATWEIRKGKPVDDPRRQPPSLRYDDEPCERDAWPEMITITIPAQAVACVGGAAALGAVYGFARLIQSPSAVDVFVVSAVSLLICAGIILSREAS